MLSRLMLTLTVLTPALNATPAASQEPLQQPAATPHPAPAPQPVRQPRPISKDETDGARYQVWIVVKPDGLHFVQSSEELKTIRHNPPANGFLIACYEFEMKGAPGDAQPSFVLDCRHAAVFGRYGTQKFVAMEGENLRYDTRERILQVSGSDDNPVRFSVEDGREMTVTAAQIQLQLGDADYHMCATGVQMEFHAAPARPVQPAAVYDDPMYPAPTRDNGTPARGAVPRQLKPVRPKYNGPSTPLPTY